MLASAKHKSYSKVPMDSYSNCVSLATHPQDKSSISSRKGTTVSIMPQTVQVIRDVITIGAKLPFIAGLQPGDTLRLIARQVTPH